MPIEIKCGSCGKRYRVPDKAAGRRVTCKNCGNAISVPALQEDDILSAIDAAAEQENFADTTGGGEIFSSTPYIPPKVRRPINYKLIFGPVIAVVILIALALGGRFVWNSIESGKQTASRTVPTRKSNSSESPGPAEAEQNDVAATASPSAPPLAPSGSPPAPPPSPPAPIIAAPTVRLTPDGKPIPPPPPDVGYGDQPKPFVESDDFDSIPVVPRANGASGEDASSKTDLAVATVVAQLPRPKFAWKPVVDAEGQYIGRIAGDNQQYIEIWSVATGQKTASIPVRFGATAVGFLKGPKLAAITAVDEGLCLIDAKNGQVSGKFPLPKGSSRDLGGNEYAIAPDGLHLCIGVKDNKGFPWLLFYSNTGLLERRSALPFPAISLKTQVDCNVLATCYNKDGKKLAILVDQGSLAQAVDLLYVCDSTTGAVEHTFMYPRLSDAVGPHRDAKPIEWIADTGGLIVYGQVIIDSETGRPVARMFPPQASEPRHINKPSAIARTSSSPQIDKAALNQILAVSRKTAPMIDVGKGMPPITAFSVSSEVRSLATATRGAKPDPQLNSSPSAPVAIQIPVRFNEVGPICFSKVGTPKAVVSGQPYPRVDTQFSIYRDAPESTLQRIDLAAGRIQGPLQVPCCARLQAISPDASSAVVELNPGEFGQFSTLEVMSLDSGKLITCFSARPTSDTLGQEVTWVDMIDRDLILTRDGWSNLACWSLKDRRVVWLCKDIDANPCFTSGGQQLLVFHKTTPVILNAKTGEAVASLSDVPLENNESISSAVFSPDGTMLFATTNKGRLLQWDVKSGAIEIAIPARDQVHLEPLAMCGGYLLANNDLFDPRRKAFVFHYGVADGWHLAGDMRGNAWYVARNQENGKVFLCSARLPAPTDLSTADTSEDNVPLIHPGVRIALQVNAGSASDSITKALTEKIRQRRLGQGQTVATLRFTANQVGTYHSRFPVRTTQNGATDFNGTDLPIFECFYDLVDSNNRILYGSQAQTVRMFGTGADLMTRANVPLQQRIDDIARKQLGWWTTAHCSIPSYFDPSGRIVTPPERWLTADGDPSSSDGP